MNISQAAPQLESDTWMLAILPIGSCEQHGSHLPVNTDLLIAQLLGEQLEKAFGAEKALLLPSLPFSCSWEHKGLGTIALNTSTVAAVLYDIAASLKNWKNKIVLVLLNWHGGNGALASIATEITARVNIPTTVINAISQAGNFWEGDPTITSTDIHAGAIETSIIKAYWPDLVGDTGDSDFTPKIAPANMQSVLQMLNSREITDRGVWGHPSFADADKGRFIITQLIKDIHAQLEKLLELAREHYDREETR